MSDLGEARRIRFGLAPRFTLPITILVSILITIMGFVVYSGTAESLKNQFDQQGVFAARVAAAPEIDSWDKNYNTVKDLQHRIGLVDALLAKEGSSSDLSPVEEARIRAQINAHDDAQVKYNRARLHRILDKAGSGRIYLDLWILNRDNVAKATATEVVQGYDETGGLYGISSSPESIISAGNYHTKSGVEPARFFRHPIKDRTGADVGTAVVVFSEKGIRAELAGLRGKIIVFCILGIVASALVAYFTSKAITRPLGALLTDIKTVAAGDLEHQTRPRSEDEIGSLAVAFNQMTRNLAAAEVMRLDLADKERQVSLAHEVQERLFPRKLPSPPGLQLDAANRLASDLSTDLFDALTLPDGRVGLLVMTASGQGIPAAIVLSMARSLFRAKAPTAASPADALKAINALLAPDLRRGMYVSALYAVVDQNNGDGLLASAGLRFPALHYIASSGGLRKIQADGIAMGLDKGPVFDRSLTETPFRLGESDRLVLTTEGAVGLVAEDGTTLDDQVFLRIVLTASKEGATAAATLEALDRRLGQAKVNRDVTLVQATRAAP
jgi:serine phosphatase RsbU (regulator of sigma subunit)